MFPQPRTQTFRTSLLMAVLFSCSVLNGVVVCASSAAGGLGLADRGATPSHRQSGIQHSPLWTAGNREEMVDSGAAVASVYWAVE